MVFQKFNWNIYSKVSYFFCAFLQLSHIFIAPEASPLTYSSRCPAVKGNGPQWIQYRDYCYASNQALHNFSEAKQFCSELGELKFIYFLWFNNIIIGMFLKKSFETMIIFLKIFLKQTQSIIELSPNCPVVGKWLSILWCMTSMEYWNSH